MWKALPEPQSCVPCWMGVNRRGGDQDETNLKSTVKICAAFSWTNSSGASVALMIWKVSISHAMRWISCAYRSRDVYGRSGSDSLVC